jgi:hypothetical protein
MGAPLFPGLQAFDAVLRDLDLMALQGQVQLDAFGYMKVVFYN